MLSGVCFTCISVKLGADCVLCRISRLCNNRLNSVRLDWQRASSGNEIYTHQLTNSLRVMAQAHPPLRDLSKGGRLDIIYSFVKSQMSPFVSLTLCTLVHLLRLLKPSDHPALTVAVGRLQAAVAAAAGSRRLPQQAAGLGLLR